MAFNGQSTLVATGSMDNTAKLWDVQKGHEVATLHVSFFCFLVTWFCVFFAFYRGSIFMPLFHPNVVVKTDLYKILIKHLILTDFHTS